MRRISKFLIAMGSILLLGAAAARAEVPGTLETTLEFMEIDGVMVPFQSGAPMPDFEPQDHDMFDLSGAWKKDRRPVDHDLSMTKRDEATITAIETEGGGRHLPAFNDSTWPTHELPGVEDVMPGDEDSPPEPYFDGVWYRRSFEIPTAWAGNTNRLICLGADYIFDLWINGEWVGVHEGGYTPFALDITPYLNYGNVNLFAIRIDNPFPGTRQDAVPNWLAMDWWSYTGIVQSMYLESSPAVHVVRTMVTPLDYNGNVSIKVVVANDSAQNQEATVNLEIYHADPEAPGYLTDPSPTAIIGEQSNVEGTPLASLTVPAGDVRAATINLRIKSPRRWTPTEPNLYVMKTILDSGREDPDMHYTQFGIRTVSRENGQMLVNGRVAFFPGMARHEEWPDSGRTATWDKILNDLEIIKDLNALFFRSGHYPNHVYTYLLTDRLGLATMVEVPVYWYFGWNWAMEEERHIAQQMFREMALSNYNRPSIILWGTENECVFLWSPKITQYNQTLADDHRENYPDGRLISQSPAADSWKLIDETQAPLDVAGWTTYYGVFYDEFPDTLKFINDHVKKWPEYPIVSTEFGTWSESDDSAVQEQVTAFNETWKYFAQTAALDAQGNINPDGHLTATTWFCVFNWFTKNGLPEFIAPYLQSMGLIHMDRTNFKPVAEVLAAAYEPYAAFGGLGPAPEDYVDDDDTTADDDSTPDDDTTPDDDATPDDDVVTDDDDDSGDDDDNGGCGC